MRIEYLYRYPVKGLTAEALEAAEVKEGGCIPWDRAFALAQGDGGLMIGERGKQFAEAPDPALIDGMQREPAIEPNRLQLSGIRVRRFPARISNLEQVSALRTAKILAGLIAEISAPNAAEAESRLTHARRGSGKRRHGRIYFSSRRYWSVLLIQSARGGVKTSRSTVSSIASALCGMCAGMQSTSPAWTTISLLSIQNFKAPSRM